MCVCANASSVHHQPRVGSCCYQVACHKVSELARLALNDDAARIHVGAVSLAQVPARHELRQGHAKLLQRAAAKRECEQTSGATQASSLHRAANGGCFVPSQAGTTFAARAFKVAGFTIKAMLLGGHMLRVARVHRVTHTHLTSQRHSS